MQQKCSIMRAAVGPGSSCHNLPVTSFVRFPTYTLALAENWEWTERSNIKY